MRRLASTEILSSVTFEGFTSSGSRELPCGGGGVQPRHGFGVRCLGNGHPQAAGRSRAEKKGLVVVVPRLVSGGYHFVLVDDREKLCVASHPLLYI